MYKIYFKRAFTQFLSLIVLQTVSVYTVPIRSYSYSINYTTPIHIYTYSTHTCLYMQYLYTPIHTVSIQYIIHVSNWNGDICFYILNISLVRHSKNLSIEMLIKRIKKRIVQNKKRTFWSDARVAQSKFVSPGNVIWSSLSAALDKNAFNRGK